MIEPRAAVLERKEAEHAALTAAIGLAEIRAARCRISEIHLTHKEQPLDFQRYPYLRDIYEDYAQHIVIKKSAQCGVTEYLLVHTIAASSIGYQVLYYLPDKDIVGKIVQERVNKPLKFVETYRKLVEISLGDTDRVGLKHIGRGSAYFQGTQGGAKGISDAGDVIIVDEYDACDASTLDHLDSRLKASAIKQKIFVSNPKFPGTGISALFDDSDVRLWHIVCPRCSLAQPLDWYVHVVETLTDSDGNVRDYILRDRAWKPNLGREIFLPCRSCREPLPRLERDPKRAFWRPTNPAGEGHGYQISSLFSPNARISALWKKFIAAQNNPSKMQSFHTFELGIGWAPPGSRVTDEILDDCRRAGWRLPRAANKETRAATMGIDVGAQFFHVRISDRPTLDIRRALFIGRVRGASQLLVLARRYKVRSMVIDELPETRLAKGIVAAFRKAQIKAWRVGGLGTSQDSGAGPKLDEDEWRVSYGRTLLLDDATQDLHDRRNILPLDAASLDEGTYYPEMCANSRVMIDTNKGVVARWDDVKPNDHRFADAYDKLAAHEDLAGRSWFGGGQFVTGGVKSMLDRPESFL